MRPRIVDAFRPLDEVEVLLWDPGMPPRPEDRPVNTERPSWTPARAAIVALMAEYRVMDEILTSLEAQKLAYFLQQAGFDGLRLRFTKHSYGPYADQLYHLLQRLEGHFIRGLVDRRPRAELRVLPDAAEEARRELDRTPRVKSLFERVLDLIEGFETPYGMELLATVHWVAVERPEARVDPDAAWAGVRAWSPRKRSTMRPRHVRVAWNRLHAQGWLASG